MGLPDTDVARVRRWLDAKNDEAGEHINEMRVELDIDARAITILDCRPPWHEDFGSDWIRQEVARLRYTSSAGTWRLLWPDRHGKFHAYDDVTPTAKVQRLLDEIDADPMGIFWG